MGAFQPQCKAMNISKAGVDLVLIQTSALLI